MLNIKITLQQKWTKYFHISKFEKSQMDKMNYTWKKIIYIIQHVLYTLGTEMFYSGSLFME